MRSLFLIALALLYVRALRADSPALTIVQHRLPSPAPVGARSPTFIATPDTPLIVTWIETNSDGSLQRVGAVWDSATAHWSATNPLPPTEPTSAAGTPPRVTFPDGSELSVFFPEKDGRILDLHTQRRHHDRVSAPLPLTTDSWPANPAAPKPFDPPLLRARDARVITVWLNHAEKSLRLFAALSTSAGEQFFLPIRIDDGHPLGRASLVLLRDGSAYISWIETSGPESAAALWLRRLSPAGYPSIPVLITTAPSADALGHPQLALLKDYDATPAQLLIAHELTGNHTTQLVTRLITLPPADSFINGRPCLTCPPDPATLPGHPLSGRVVKLLPQKHQVVITHSEVPGILPAGETTFHLDDSTLASLHHVTALLARIEKRDGLWWLFDVNALITPGSH